MQLFDGSINNDYIMLCILQYGKHFIQGIKQFTIYSEGIDAARGGGGGVGGNPYLCLFKWTQLNCSLNGISFTLLFIWRGESDNFCL